MQNLALILLGAILCAVLAPYVVRALTHIIYNWTRTTTLFFFIFFTLFVILLVAKNV